VLVTCNPLLQVMLASDLLWHIGGREATAAVGYDVSLRQARLQGKIDSTGAHGKLIGSDQIHQNGVPVVGVSSLTSAGRSWLLAYPGIAMLLVLRCV
jgi:hypothetical protein